MCEAQRNFAFRLAMADENLIPLALVHSAINLPEQASSEYESANALRYYAAAVRHAHKQLNSKAQPISDTAILSVAGLASYDVSSVSQMLHSIPGSPTQFLSFASIT